MIEELVNSALDREETAIMDKMQDLETVGLSVEFDPVEAEIVGAFFEDAMSEDE